MPDKEQMHAAANILNFGRRIAILAGQGALAAHPKVQIIPETLAVSVAKALPTMAPGLPFASAVQFADPARMVFAVGQPLKFGRPYMRSPVAQSGDRPCR